jgi:hypothetical protein
MLRSIWPRQKREYKIQRVYMDEKGEHADEDYYERFMCTLNVVIMIAAPTSRESLSMKEDIPIQKIIIVISTAKPSGLNVRTERLEYIGLKRKFASQ